MARQRTRDNIGRPHGPIGLTYGRISAAQQASLANQFYRPNSPSDILSDREQFPIITSDSTIITSDSTVYLNIG